MSDNFDFTPTEDQQHAMDKIREFMARPIDPQDIRSRVCTLTGPAGSGKTTLLRMIAAEISGAIICAPTNKAVAQLRKNGFSRATTLDKVLRKKIYVPNLREPNKAEREYYAAEGVAAPEFIVEDHYEEIDNEQVGQAVVLDEASMSNLDDLAKLLLLYDKIIIVGDGFQLPPVDGEAWFQEYDHDIVLHKIVRTGEGSEITALANLVRGSDKNWSKQNWHGEVTIISNWEKHWPEASEALKTADLVIAFKNKKCDQLNPIIRGERGLMRDDDPTRPVKGDYLLSWGMDKKQNIYKSERYQVHKAVPVPGGYQVTFLQDGELHLAAVNKATLQQQTSALSFRDYMNFSFGHCITAHKSQGGEWDNVVVMLDKPSGHPDYWNWLYTAVSRAKKKLTILR